MHTRLTLIALTLALVAVPAIVLAGGGSADTGYETSAATVDVVDDSAVSLSPASGSNGQYAEVAANGELALRFEDLNEDAETTADRVFEIEASDSTTQVRVESGPPGVSFYWGGDPGADASETRRLEPGESVAVGVRIDSYDEVGDGDFTVIAEQAAQPSDGDVSVVDANVSPTEIAVGESVNASATLYNAGSSSTPHRVELSVDGTVVDERFVAVPAGSHRTVTFERAFQQSGEYAIEVAGREAGTVAVRPNKTESGGGGFVVSNASVSPSTIQPGETATITADVTNRGGAGELFTAELAVGGAVVEEQAVEVPVGETRTVTFGRTFEHRGGYELSVSGADAGTLQVESSTASSMRRYGSEWGWLLGAATVPTLGAAFVAARRRGKLVKAE